MLLNIDLTVLATIANFLILVAVLTFVLYRPVARVMRERRERIQRDLAEADRARSEAVKAREEYEAHLRAARKEGLAILESLTREGEQTRDRIIAQAREEAARIRQRAESEAAALKESTLRRLQDDIVEIAFRAARRVLEREVDRATSEEFVRQLMDELPATGIAEER